MSLRDLQVRFLAAVTAAGGYRPPPDDLAGIVRGSADLGPAARLAIYADMYSARLLDVLREDYPRLACELGEERFDALARGYVAAHPSRHPSVRWVGGRFAAFVGASADAAARPWLEDLARLEWQRGEVFDAADARPLGLERLKAEPPDRWGALPLALIPALRLLSSPWPVHDIWAGTGMGGDTPPRPARTALRIWRQGFSVYHAAMEPVEARALARVRAGGDLGAVCEAVAELVPAEAAPREAGALLLRWIEDGILADLSPAGAPTP